MYLRKTVKKVNGRVYEYWLIVEGYRDKDGKVKQRIIRRLGKLTNEEVAKWRAILSINSLKETVITRMDDIKIKSVREGTSVLILDSLWKYLGLKDLISSLVNEKTQKITEALVINRCVHPNSDYKVSSWYKKTVLPFIQSEEAISATEIYRTLDRILEIEKETQVHLYKKIKQIKLDKFDLSFYDLTSTYFEGKGPPIAVFGHSRDGKNNKKQIILGMATTKNGFPFWWKIFEGNTVDSLTLIEAITALKEQFKLKECVLVIDKGIVTNKNLDLLEREGYFFISTIKRSRIRKLPQFPEEFFRTINENNLSEKLTYFNYYNKRAYYKELGRVSNRRYILCFNPEKFIEERRNREEKLSSIEKYFDNLNKELKNAKYNRNKEKLQNRIYYYLKKRGSLRFFKVKVTEEGIEYRRNISAIKREELLDGVYVLCTNLMSKTPQDLIKAYQNRIKIECAFHHIKSFVEVRPIYHRLSNRVRSHVFVCVLAYLLNLIFEHFVREKIEDLTIQRIYEELEKEDACEIEIKNVGIRKIKLKEPSPLVQKILKILSSRGIMDENFLINLRCVSGN